MIILTILRLVIMYGLAHVRLMAAIVPSIPVIPTIVVAAVVSIYTWVHINDTKSCLAAENAVNSKMDKKHAKIETKVDSLAHAALVKRLRHFSRD